MKRKRKGDGPRVQRVPTEANVEVMQRSGHQHILRVWWADRESGLTLTRHAKDGWIILFHHGSVQVPTTDADGQVTGHETVTLVEVWEVPND